MVHFGFQTGDFVKAVVPGREATGYLRAVTIRASVYFRM